jgi:hypothetical protein
MLVALPKPVNNTKFPLGAIFKKVEQKNVKVGNKIIGVSEFAQQIV